MEKICHMTSVHKRDDTRIFHKECKTLAKEGYDVYLLVNDTESAEEIDGVKIITTNLFPKSRWERFFKSHKKLFKKALEVDADIYHFHDPDLLFMGLKLKKKGKRVIFDSHENVREDIKDKTYIPKMLRNLISRIYSLIEEYVLKRIDAVIGVDPEQMVLLKRIGHNATMVSNFPTLLESEDEKSNEKSGICFAGGIVPQWSHEMILNVLDKVGVVYKMCGPVDADYLEKLERHPNWKNVEYLGRINHEEVLGFLKNSVIGMALLKPMNNMGKDGTLGCNKIFEYMRAGIPLIATNFPLWKNIIDEYECGICVDINSEEEVTKAIQYLIQNAGVAEKMGENGKKAFLEKYNWETQALSLKELYKRLVSL